MIELKFRVRDSEKKSMYYYNTLSQFCSQYYAYGERGIFTPLPYTWLKDKNGKEIYEGDILSEYNNGVVKFYRWRFIAFYDNWIAEEVNEETRRDGVEVIWNIYENPELLED